MKKPIVIVGFVILILVLGLSATLVTVSGLFRLGKFLLPQHPGTIVLVVGLGLAILGGKGAALIRGYTVRKIREKGVPEPPESERTAVHFWVRATLATITILVVLLRALHKW